MKYDQHKERTFTNTWNNFDIEFKSKKKNLLSIFLKKIKKKIKKIFKIKINITKLENITDSSFSSYQNDKQLLNFKNTLLEKKIVLFLKKLNIKNQNNNIKKYIKEFNKIYFNSPIKHLGSGMGYNQGLFVFIIIKIIKPTDVIESGVMRGFTTYLIDKSTNQNTKIHCYDISFEKLLYKSPKAVYHMGDIETKLPEFKGNKILSLYDDHVSHLHRLELSKKLKVKYNIFDDDLNFLNFHSDGWPPLPTINMLKNYDKIKVFFKNKKILKWISQNRKGEINLNIFKKEVIIKKNYKYNIFPELFEITGYRNHGQTSILIL